MIAGTLPIRIVIAYLCRMKIKFVSMAACMVAGLSLLISCESSNDAQENPEITSTYICPAQQADTSQMYAVSFKGDTLVGCGYDVTGSYLDARNVKRCVVDIPDSDIEKFSYLKSDAAFYIGADANDYLQNIMYDNGFSLNETSNENKWFTGTIKDNYGKFPADYSTAHSFAGKDVFFTKTIMRMPSYITANNIKHISKYLTAQFKDDLNRLTASQLVAKYGTHVLRNAYIGTRIRGMMNCVVADKLKDAAKDAFYGLCAKMSEAVGSTNLDVLNADKAAMCSGGTLHADFNGGDVSKVHFMNGSIVTAVYKQWWNSDDIDMDHFALTELQKDDVIPLYEFIADEEKKEAVKNAINQYIADSQIEEPQMLPLFQAFMGPHHKYVTSYDDAQNTSGLDASDTKKCKAPLGLIYKNQKSGTTPLYRFSNAKNDRLSISSSIDNAGDYQSNGVMGYVFSSPVPSAKCIAVYELWNGSHDYAYTTENTESYGSTGTWKRTGKVFYVVRM